MLNAKASAPALIRIGSMSPTKLPLSMVVSLQSLLLFHLARGSRLVGSRCPNITGLTAEEHYISNLCVRIEDNQKLKHCHYYVDDGSHKVLENIVAQQNIPQFLNTQLY